MGWALFLLFAAGAALLAVKTLNELRLSPTIGADIPPQSTIVVSGESEVFVKPTVATFSFSVTEEGKTVADAQKKATEKSNAAIDFLTGKGIDDKYIKTTGYNIYPKYESTKVDPQLCTQWGCPPGRQVIVGYEVSQSMEIKVKDLEKAGDILSGIGSLEVQNVSGLSFSVDEDDQREFEAQAREQAIAQAREQAKKLASDLGVHLVRIVSFSEGGNSYYPMKYDSRATMGMGAAMAESAPAPALPTGENKITSNVSITYEIR